MEQSKDLGKSADLSERRACWSAMKQINQSVITTPPSTYQPHQPSPIHHPHIHQSPIYPSINHQSTDPLIYPFTCKSANEGVETLCLVRTDEKGQMPGLQPRGLQISSSRAHSCTTNYDSITWPADPRSLVLGPTAAALTTIASPGQQIPGLQPRGLQISSSRAHSCSTNYDSITWPADPRPAASRTPDLQILDIGPTAAVLTTIAPPGQQIPGLQPRGLQTCRS